MSATSEFGTYDFGLTDDDERRARQLHDRSIIVDMLHQGPCGHRAFADHEEELRRQYAEHGDRSRLYSDAGRLLLDLELRGESKALETTLGEAGITSITREVDFFGSTPAEVLGTFARVQQQFDTFPWLRTALRAEDFARAKSDGAHVGVLNTQYPDRIVNDVTVVDALHGLGLRQFQLTYNVMNEIAAGCTERTDAGVSMLGVRWIQRMNELGIIVDTGHCGHRTTLDACEISTKPVIASHTAAQGVFHHDRGKSDEELRALADTGGVIGIVAVPFFLSADAAPTVEVLLDHLDHVIDLVGWQHVGIGADWPMQYPKFVLDEVLPSFTADMGFRPEHQIRPSLNLIGFDDSRDFLNITRGLVSRGHGDDAIVGILGGNYIRVFDEVVG